MGVYSGTPRTWTAGETVTAALMNSDTRDPIKALSDAYTAYTPTWTAASTNPVIGNGSITGAYTRVGKFISFRVAITMGSTTTSGTGQWRLTLPVTARSELWGFFVTARDDSVPARYAVYASWSSSGYVEFYAPATTAGNADRTITGTSPFTWAQNDNLFIHGEYEAA
jgi:hypothetical protein